MIKRSIIVAVLITISFLSLGFSLGLTSSLLTDLQEYLPAEKELGGWKKDGALQEYKGEDLFLYIDGGAEIYQEYGFKQVAVQDYINKRGKSISLEIFEMVSNESAYGIYTFKTHSSGKEVALGDGAQLADYYLNFWEGNFLVTLTGFDEERETINGLLTIAKAIDRKIQVKGKIPPIVELLPKNDLVKPSIKYFKGNLGLYNSYRFFTQDIFSLKQGIKGDYRDGYSVFIVRYSNDDECKERFGEVKKRFKESQRYKNYRFLDEFFIQVSDRKDRSIFIALYKNYILIILGNINYQKSRLIFDTVQENIRKKDPQLLFLTEK